MPFTLMQVGGSLKSMNSTGAFSGALTLPSGVLLAQNVTPRFAKFKSYVIVVNSPTRPLSVDSGGIVRSLTPAAPGAPLTLTGVTSGALSGTYLALQTYKLLDSSGNTIAESDYGPAMSAAVAISSKKLHAAFAVSPEAVSATQLYRTATLGGTYFPWARVDGNVTTSYEDDQSDASLGTIAGPSLGMAPDLTLIAEFAGRLWGVSRGDVDSLRYTEAGTMYGWSGLNTMLIPHVGSDAAGITALIPRRNALGVSRLNLFQQVTGSTRANFQPVVVHGGEQVGCVSQESVVTFNDIAFFLWRDGVYKWDAYGITSITNGKVRSWFTSDLYFNRAMFWKSFAQLDPIGLKYRLFLASVGSTTIDRWIEYDLATQTWWGPHKTDAFSPSCALLVAGSNMQPYFMIGSREGFVSKDQEARNDWDIAPIALSVETKSHNPSPDDDKYWGELSVIGKAQPAGSITITPSVGELDNTPAQAPFTYDMTQGRQRLGRLGVGKQASLKFDHAVLNQDVALFGYEINPVNIVGRR